MQALNRDVVFLERHKRILACKLELTPKYMNAKYKVMFLPEKIINSDNGTITSAY
jgi:hypothetical protein